jgi:hypothetical protein
MPGAGMPMMPPGGMGGGTNPQGAERPDSAGLLGGIDAPWTPDAPSGVGDPSSAGETPALGAASWSAPAVPVTSPGGVGGGERLDSAGPLGGVDGPRTPGTAGDPVTTAGTPAMPMLPPMAPPGTGTTADRPDSAGLLGGEASAWATGDTPGDPDPADGTPRGGWATAVPVSGWGTAPVGKSTSDDDDVRISVVRPVETTEDTSAWDVGTAEFLPGLLPFAPPAPARESEVDVGTDLVERGDEPWRPADEDPGEPRGTYQRIRVGDGEFIPDELPTCGDGPVAETEAEAPEAEAAEGEEEEPERTMADLLSQDDSAWGRPASRPSGVLE